MIQPIEEKNYSNVYPLATLPAMKDVGLRIRVQRELREEFLAACKADDKPAAQVIREFMREYVSAHKAGLIRQINLTNEVEK